MLEEPRGDVLRGRGAARSGRHQHRTLRGGPPAVLRPVLVLTVPIPAVALGMMQTIVGSRNVADALRVKDVLMYRLSFRIAIDWGRRNNCRLRAR